MRLGSLMSLRVRLLDDRNNCPPLTFGDPAAAGVPTLVAGGVSGGVRPVAESPVVPAGAGKLPVALVVAAGTDLVSGVGVDSAEPLTPLLLPVWLMPKEPGDGCSCGCGATTRLASELPTGTRYGAVEGDAKNRDSSRRARA
jgi:hypothetical protein